MGQGAIGVICLVIGVIVTAFSKQLFKFFKEMFDGKNQSVSFITHKEVDDKINQCYSDFVKKETYSEHKQAVEEEFKAFRGELKEIKDAQTSQTGKISEIDKNVALVQKDLSYMCKALDNLPKRKED